MISDLLQKSQVFLNLSSDKKYSRLSHAYLVLGDDLETRKVFLNLIALLLLCENDGCMHCKPCAKVMARTHLDMMVLNEDSSLKTSNLSPLLDFVYVKPAEAKYKLVFIDNADSLNETIQNKLLKLYEEPPENVIIFMFSKGETGILKTIKSRAKLIYLPVFSNKQIYEELLEQGIEESVAEAAAIMSGGQFHRAYLFSNQEGYLDMFNSAVQLLKDIKWSKDITKHMNSTLFSKENIEITLDYFQIIFKDVLVFLSQSRTEYATMKRNEDIEEIAKGYNAGGVALAILSISNAKKMLSSNVSPQSVIETLLFQILEDKYKAKL